MALPAVIELAFDPAVRVGDLFIRWQTIGITLALLYGVALASWFGDRANRAPAAGRPLRLNDLIDIILGIVPGAVVGGRLVHGLVFAEAYGADPWRLFDVSVGTLSLTGAVLGGLVSAAYVARLVGAPVGRWADTAAVPLLLTLSIGKVAQLLGGSGQGMPFDGPWAVAFIGPGPWISSMPDVPAHPSQVYEALWLLAGIPVVLATRGLGASSGVNLVVALAWFLLGRVLVGFSWRDDVLIGPFNAEQVVALVALVALGLVALGLLVRSRSIVAADTTMTPRERRT